MTKADRQEFDARMSKLDHYRRIAIESCLSYGLTSKAKELAKLRSED